MSASPEALLPFQRQQLAFAAHIRDPDANPVPGDIATGRMALYAELFFNNIDEQLSTNFPVLRNLLAEQDWCELVRDFMRRHRCTTPLFTEIGIEFIEYLQSVRGIRQDDPAFLLELAHYEYAELAVSITMAEPGFDDIDPNGDLLEQHPVVAPSAWALAYRFPVHRIGPDYQPLEPPTDPTYLVVYRDRLDDVHFLEVNPVSFRLLELLNEKPHHSGLDILKIVATELGHADPSTVIQGGAGLLADLRQRNVLLGTAR